MSDTYESAGHRLGERDGRQRERGYHGARGAQRFQNPQSQRQH